MSKKITEQSRKQRLVEETGKRCGESERFPSFEAIESHRVNASNGSKGRGVVGSSRTVVFTRTYKVAYVFVPRSSKRIHIDTRLFRNVVNTIAAFDLFLSLFIFIIPACPHRVNFMRFRIRLPLIPCAD